MLLYGLIAAGSGWGVVPFAALALGVLSLVAFGINERRSRMPMVPPGIFANPQFTTARGGDHDDNEPHPRARGSEGR